MSRRVRESVVRRPSLPITAQDEADLAALRTTPALLDSLSRLSSSQSPIEARASESLLLHALLQVGLAAVRADTATEAYAQLAADYATSSKDRRSLSRRRTPAWSHEA